MLLMPPPDAVVGILLGHMLGDYVFQNQWMALSKNRNTFRCALHCVVYAACVCMLTSWNPWWFGLVFASHFPIDRWSLGERWLKLIGGRSIEEFIRNGHEDLDLSDEASAAQRNNYIAARGGFSTLVFAAVDNTMHMVIMFVGWSLLFGGG
jgi:hypothetical protein